MNNDPTWSTSCNKHRGATLTGNVREQLVAPAVRGWKVCRMHGARGGGPTGNRNGNYRSGASTYETREAVAFLRAMARLVRKMDIA
jgi:hypothetical protein